MTSAVPEIEWFVEPSMMDKIKDMPDHPFHSLLPTWPEATRAHMATPHLNGALTAADLSIAFYGFETHPLKVIHAEVRGNGNPLPFFAGLCMPNDWKAIDCTTQSEIDLTGEAAAGWEQFRDYRDRAIETIRETQTNGDDSGQ
jgi:hypothetical protein